MTCGTAVVARVGQGWLIPCKRHIIFLELRFGSLCISGTNFERSIA